MSWRLSRFRAGDLVTVRQEDEILATLDESGCLDGMPFMPEMLQYCGRTFHVRAVAHKTCDRVDEVWKGRRLDSCVHLHDLRCDGAAHGGCQAGCSLFWKDAWLRLEASAEGDSHPSSSHGPQDISRQRLHQLARQDPDAPTEQVLYSCQATMLTKATRPLAWWDLRQYARDVRTGNRRIGHALRVLLLAFLKEAYLRAPRGYRALQKFREGVHRLLMNRSVPEFRGTIPRNTPTPTGHLGLNPGDRVRIRSKEEIESTLDWRGRNRGMYYDVEMSRYCGGEYVVQGHVSKIIDETTGKMIEMKQPCVVLTGVVCRSEYSQHRLMCPRAIPSYWRELWLERLATNEAEQSPEKTP